MIGWSTVIHKTPGVRCTFYNIKKKFLTGFQCYNVVVDKVYVYNMRIGLLIMAVGPAAANIPV